MPKATDRSRSQKSAVKKSKQNSSGSKSSASAQDAANSEPKSTYENKVEEIERMFQQTKLPDDPNPAPGLDPWSSQQVGYRDASVESTKSIRNAFSDRSSSGSRDASMNGIRSARHKRTMSEGSNGNEESDPFLEWQKLNLKRSLPPAPPVIRSDKIDGKHRALVKRVDS
jgi:hypothetical protein